MPAKSLDARGLLMHDQLVRPMVQATVTFFMIAGEE
jgi:hypothetical protein